MYNVEVHNIIRERCFAGKERRSNTYFAMMEAMYGESNSVPSMSEGSGCSARTAASVGRLAGGGGAGDHMNGGKNAEWMRSFGFAFFAVAGDAKWIPLCVRVAVTSSFVCRGRLISPFLLGNACFPELGLCLSQGVSSVSGDVEATLTGERVEEGKRERCVFRHS